MQSFLLFCSLLAAENATIEGDYEKSQVYLSAVKVTPENQTQVLYLKSVNAFGLNDKRAATEAIEQFELASTPETPIRYRNLLFCLKNNLTTWEDPLLDIERDMRISSDKMNNGYTGKRTQEIQKQIVDKLDKLIKEKEDEKNKKMMKLNGGQGDGDIKGFFPGSGGSQPAPDSQIMGGSGEGKVTEAELKKIGEQWGSLPPARQQKIIEDLTRDLPTKYKPQIEAYFKSLQRIK